MRKEILATLLISIYWIIAGFFVAYAAWDHAYMIAVPAWQSNLPDPFALGITLAVIGLIFSFVVLRTMLPSRATQRQRLIKLLDEVGVEDMDLIQRKLKSSALENSVSSDADEIDRAVSLRALLQEQKRKNSSG